MNIRCMIIEKKSDFRTELESILKENSSAIVESTDSTYEALYCLAKFFPNLIFLRCHDQKINYEQIFSAIQRAQMQTVVIPLIGDSSADLLKTIMLHKFVIDILMDDAHPRRIRDAIQKAMARISGDTTKISAYRGFIGFIGVTPSLRERKIIQQARLGIIHNRSMRLAIDYWRKNQNSQLVSIILNANCQLTNRNDDAWQCLRIADSKPWEIAMFEAQNHYMQYWKEAIQCGLLNPMISTIIYSNSENFEIIDENEQKKILIRVGNKAKNEAFDANFQSLGMPFRIKNELSKKPNLSILSKGWKSKLKKYINSSPISPSQSIPRFRMIQIQQKMNNFFLC